MGRWDWQAVSPHSLLMQPGAAFVIPARDGRAASAWGSHKQCRGVWRGAGAKQPHNLRRYNATPHFKRVQCNRAQPTVWSRCQLPRGQPSLSWTHLFVWWVQCSKEISALPVHGRCIASIDGSLHKIYRVDRLQPGASVQCVDTKKKRGPTQPWPHGGQSGPTDVRLRYLLTAFAF